MEPGAEEVVMGVNVTRRLSATTTLSVCVPLKDCAFVIGPDLEKLKEDKFNLPIEVVFQGSKYPPRFQSPPLTLSKFKQITKLGYGFAVMNFDYKSAINRGAASKWRLHMAGVDSKILAWLVENRKTVWPEVDLTPEQVEERYSGLATQRKWEKPVDAAVPVLPQSGEKNMLLKETEDGKSFTLVEAEAASEEPTPKKRKCADAKADSHDIVGAGEGKQVFEYPPQYTIFPALRGKVFTARCTGIDGKPLKINSLQEGAEVVTVADLRLGVRGGRVYASLTGHRFKVKQLDVASHCDIANEMFFT